MASRISATVLGLIIAAGIMAGHADAQQPPTSTPEPPSSASAAKPKRPSPPTITSSGPLGRFKIEIDPNTPIEELLPTPPAKPIAGPVLKDDLALTPEAEFQARIDKATKDGAPASQIALQLAKINHLNAKKTDAFMTALLEHRADLAGLPFVMGDDCRMSRENLAQFMDVANTMRMILRPGTQLPKKLSETEKDSAASSPFARFFSQEEKSRARSKELAVRARVAAITQILAVESVEIRLGLVKYLAGVSHADATKALARLAIFSVEEKIRAAAADALTVRPGQDYTDILLKGLRYPWPAVAKRSAELIARMRRTDLVSELVALVSTDDPRMPVVKTVEGTQVTTVRELVKVNHNRNCMLCHAPADSSNPFGSTAPVPVPTEPFPAAYYQQSSEGMEIRFDVTYLRQDFSTMLPVENAKPWPAMQRFDFLVRERKLTLDEAKEYRAKLTPKEGEASPYHQAAQKALRELSQ